MRLSETRDGAADGIVQGERRGLRAGAENEPGADRRSGGLQHRESRSGGGGWRETIWNQGQDIFSDELQTSEAGGHCGAGGGPCGEVGRGAWRGRGEDSVGG